jgi:magnesium chelatase family protein
MLAEIHSGALTGIEAYVVSIEVNAGHGEPKTVVVGLPDAAVKESADRVWTALLHSGFEPPKGRTTINLAPANRRKEGPCFDLPIALGILAATDGLRLEGLNRICVVGELALSGAVRPVRGVLPLTLMARAKGFTAVMVPAENAEEAAVVQGIKVFAVRTLRTAADFLNRTLELEPFTVDVKERFLVEGAYEADFQDVKGQERAKRALEVSVSGGHNLLMMGSPGSGKSMLAKRVPSILPPLSLDEALEVTQVHSICGRLQSHQALVARRPFESPHHTVSDAGLLGGGSNPLPGSVSLAHHGVLFLDELPEFQRHVLEVMRQPMEEGWVQLVRAGVSVVYPCRFMLVAAMNPCPCGFLSDPLKVCRCSPRQIERYRGKISGPLLDRIDLQLEVPPVPFETLREMAPGERSALIRARVVAARERQRIRFERVPGVFCNAQMPSRLMASVCRMEPEAEGLLRAAMQELQLSARAYNRILKVARTVADLAEAEWIGSDHVAEAVGYRSLDRPLS